MARAGTSFLGRHPGNARRTVPSIQVSFWTQRHLNPAWPLLGPLSSRPASANDASSVFNNHNMEQDPCGSGATALFALVTSACLPATLGAIATPNMAAFGCRRPTGRAIEAKYYIPRYPCTRPYSQSHGSSALGDRHNSQLPAAWVANDHLPSVDQSMER